MVAHDSVSSLGPGFRFHPTDEELIRYYLKRKVCSKPSRFDPISVVDVYKSEPWDLPDKSKLKSRDLEWYFYTALDKKYGNGSKTNRATENGYWKTTGKDREIRYYSRISGMKKTLVYHMGRAPRGQRTNWVMHEYRLIDEELAKAGVVQDAFVLCRIFQKSGPGPKNGEKYGAPFVEEEWEWESEDDVGLVPVKDSLIYGENKFLNVNETDQKLDTHTVCADTSLSSNFHYGESSSYAEAGNIFEAGNCKVPDNYVDLGNYIDLENYIDSGNCESGNYIEQASDTPEYQKRTFGIGDMQCGSDGSPDEQKICELQNIDAAESNHTINLSPTNYLLDETYMKGFDNIPLNNSFFSEANDLSNETDGFDIEDYLKLFADDENFDSSQILETSDSAFNQAHAPLSEKQHLLEESEQVFSVNKDRLEEGQDGKSSTSSKQELETKNSESDIKYPFLKQVSHMLGEIDAPPAFASEFPTNDAVLQLNPGALSGHVTTGMMRIRSTSLAGYGMDLSYAKNGNINVVFSIGLPHGDASSTDLVSATNVSGKTGPSVTRGLLYLTFMWVLILSISFKIGVCVHSR